MLGFLPQPAWGPLKEIRELLKRAGQERTMQPSCTPYLPIYPQQSATICYAIQKQKNTCVASFHWAIRQCRTSSDIMAGLTITIGIIS